MTTDSRTSLRRKHNAEKAAEPTILLDMVFECARNKSIDVRKNVCRPLRNRA
jgi:hypothetical protein